MQECVSPLYTRQPRNNDNTTIHLLNYQPGSHLARCALTVGHLVAVDDFAIHHAALIWRSRGSSGKSASEDEGKLHSGLRLTRDVEGKASGMLLAMVRV